MVSHRNGLYVMVLFLSMVLALPGTGLLAQDQRDPMPYGSPGMGPGGGGPGMPGRPGMPPGGPGGQGHPGMMGGRPEFGGPGGMGKPPFNEAEHAKMRERRQRAGALRTMAEAHKQLAELFQEQGKIDEAVAELKKIIALSSRDEGEDDEPKISRNLVHVYFEIAAILGKAERYSEAETILNEGIEKLKKDDLEGASRLTLHLGKMYQKANKPADAEKAFKRVIELNSQTLDRKK
jgi:hypothetical protein